MANATVTSTYVGQLALPCVAPAILAADSIANGYVATRQNVRYKAVLRKVSGVAIQDADCAFGTPSSGQLVISDVVLTTAQLKVNEQICNNELREAWESEMMRGASSAAPGELTNYVAQWMAARVAASVEQNIWQGNFLYTTGATTGGSFLAFSGILAAIVAGTPSNEITYAGATVKGTTAVTGCLTRLAAAVADIPDAIIGDYENTKIFVSRKFFALYMESLAGTLHHPFLAADKPAQYLGYDVLVPAGFPDDTILICRVDNNVFGTDLLTDMTKATFLNMLGQTGEDSTRGIMQFAAGAQVIDLDSLQVSRRSS